MIFHCAGALAVIVLFSFPLKTRVVGRTTPAVFTHMSSHLPFLARGDAVHRPDLLSAQNFGGLKFKWQTGLITVKDEMWVVCDICILHDFLQEGIKSETKQTFYKI